MDQTEIKKKNRFLLFSLPIVAFISFVMWWMHYNGGLFPCSGVTIGELQVRGKSMYPMLRSGDLLKHRKSFYECRYKSVERDDLVTFRFPGRDTIVVKRVLGIPGDRFEYKKPKLFLNGKQLKNSAGQNYVINSKMLNLYSKDYPIIPEGSYLVLGDNQKGALDSSRFGYLSRAAIVGKAEKQ